jgi:protein involved in polysaccharide export with SLBB domain
LFRKKIAMFDNVTKSRVRISYFLFIFSGLLLTILTGCGNKFFDPTQVGRFRTVPSVNVILDSLGVAEETPIAWEEGEEPKPVDTISDVSDYAFRAGDIIRVSIFELLGSKASFEKDFPVTETGRISIPEVGVVEVAGLTETQLEERIKQILSPSLLKNPLVTITLISSQQRAFSILGDGVLAPSRYVIPRYNFKLTDALAMASGPRQFNVSYIYVSRVVEDNRRLQPMSKLGSGGPELKNVGTRTAKTRQQVISSRAQDKFKWPDSKVVISSSEMIANQEYAGTRKGFDQFDNNTRSYSNQGNVWQLSAMPATTPINEPVSVQEVLDKMSERSGQPTNTDIESRPYQTQVPPSGQVNRQTSRGGISVSPGGFVTVSDPRESSNNENLGHVEWEFRNGKWVPVSVESEKPTEPQKENGHIEWVFQNGKWVPVQVGRERPTEPVIQRQPRETFIAPPEEVKAPDFGWTEQGEKTRLIKIPTDKLLAGDPRYNIIIKPGDTIFVPVDIVGEFYIMGNVNRTGPIALTGRPMTLKQAIVAAGGLAPLAWPKRCEVIRRIGRKKEEIVMVDLDKIFNGEQPDFFIKPHDTINVGTHATARWRAILRNAFRATYGFGFVYDRNFADRDFYTHRPIPDWF